MFYKRKKVVHVNLKNIKNIFDIKDIKDIENIKDIEDIKDIEEIEDIKEELNLRLKFEKNMLKLFNINTKY